MIPVDEGANIQFVSHGDWVRLMNGAPPHDILDSEEITHVVHKTDRFIAQVSDDDAPPEPLGVLKRFEGERVVVPA